MATYLILNVVFMAIVVAAVRFRPVSSLRAWVFTLVSLVLLTAIFDNLLIYFDIIAYNPDRLLGLYVGNAPVEDFFYALFAAYLIPTIWHKIGASRHETAE